MSNCMYLTLLNLNSVAANLVTQFIDVTIFISSSSTIKNSNSSPNYLKFAIFTRLNEQ